MKDNNCYMCKRTIRFADGIVKEGVVEIKDLSFCSDRCYEEWRENER